ncbi:MAG: transglutaminase-like domain-containing protein [Gemmatimonadales bacterium]
MKLGAFNRRTAAQVMLLAWAASLAWLARREFGKTESETIAEATIRLNPDAFYYSVKAGDLQVGYASLTIDTVVTGFRISQVLALDVPTEGDSVRRMTRRTDINLSRSLRLIGFTRTVAGGGQFEELRGTVEGDTLLRLAQQDGRDGPVGEWALRVEGDVALPEVLPYRLAFARRLSVGQSGATNLLDLTTGTISRLEMAATAESSFVLADSAVETRGTRLWRPARYDTVTAWRLEHAASGAPEVLWVDANGNLVESETPLGVRLTRSAFELVNINYRADLIRHTADRRRIPAMRSLLEAGLRLPRSDSAEYRVRTAGTTAPRTTWLSGGRQTTDNDRIDINRHTTGTDSVRRGFLDPAAQFRPVAPAVAAFAATIVPNAKGRAVAAGLVEWVHREIRPDPSPTAPKGAERILADRRGNAEGIASLYADLARARGLTVRVVGGVAMLDGTAYGHTWAEVRLDDGWVAVDPTFGQFPASAALLRIISGGYGRAIDLVPLVGAAVLEPNPLDPQ